MGLRWLNCLTFFACLTTVFSVPIVESQSAVTTRYLRAPVQNGTEWTEDMSWFALGYARAAYCDYSVLEQWNCNLCTPGFDVRWVSQPNKQDSQAFVGYHMDNDLIIVSFRGTQDLSNWVSDLKFAKLDFNYTNCFNVTGLEDDMENGLWKPKCTVHAGFWNTYAILKDNITATVSQLRSENPNAPILVTGHSLGAAQAGFCALDLMMAFGNVFLYNFGQPRLGNVYFAKFLKAKMDVYFRLTHNHDLVPHLPPLGKTPIFSLNFWHGPREVWQQGGGELFVYKMCDGSGEDPNCSDSVMPWELKPADHATYMGQTMHNCAAPPVPP